MYAIVSLSILAVGLGIALRVGPSILEKSLNKIQNHPPYQISPAVLDKHQALTIMDWHSDSLLWKRDLLKRPLMAMWIYLA